MHKSIIVFLGLLVILLPLGNSLNISNANAIADYDKADKKNVSVSSLKCNNINVNVNGLELNVLPPFLGGGEVTAEAAEPNTYANSFTADNNGDGSQINDFRFICINNNNNRVIGEEPIKPTLPTTASLTVKKQIFGCATETSGMFCPFGPNSTNWLDCNNSSISDSPFCLDLPENIFDIQVLDDQDTQLLKFEGSEQGTTIPNIQPGTYTVKEIKNATLSLNQLVEEPEAVIDCAFNGFKDGGLLFTPNHRYTALCIEYVDEQGNDCSTISLAAGEEKTCTVKNYILSASPQPG